MKQNCSLRQHLTCHIKILSKQYPNFYMNESPVLAKENIENF